MVRRYLESTKDLFPVKLRLSTALKEKLKEGYTKSDFKSDLMSGIVVALVAIPLAMALAIASGGAPQNGLYTVIFGGFIVALLGGSRFQVSGPTAAFVVILAPIATQFGFSGLLLAGMLAGLMLMGIGLARLGKLIQFIPYPVTTGFTAGIAVVIAVIQLKDFFGLTFISSPEKFHHRIFALWEARGSISLTETLIGLSTLGILILWPKINKKIPSPLVALSAATLGIYIIQRFFPDLHVATIGNRFTFHIGDYSGNGIPHSLPTFELPWRSIGQDGKVFIPTFDSIQELLPSAFAITMLGAIESLLSAVVADGMTQTKHDPDSELLALGIGNIVCPFFGGIAATGAIARTATNIRFGAKSPISAMIHAVFTLLVILVMAPIVSLIPMASLAALLMIVAYNMSDIKHFSHILRVAPKSDVMVLLTCFLLTVVVDMVAGVTVGVVMAALLFMQRMSKITEGQKLVNYTHPSISGEIPKDIVLYEIAGPLFFGAAEAAASALTGISDENKVVIFIMEDVPVMDVTGLVAFESAIRKLSNGKRKIFVTGLKKQPADLIRKSDLLKKSPDLSLIDGGISEALKKAKALIEATLPKESVVPPLVP